MRPFQKLSPVVAAICVLFPLQAARAETVGVVAVDKPPGPGSELAELTLQLRSALSERTPGVLDAAALRDRMTGNASTSTLAELDRAYAGALATYQNGDFEGSIRTLHAVIDDLGRLPDSPPAFAQWTRAMLRLARSEQTLGHRDVARGVLEELVRAAPGIHADPMQYPPAFEKQLRAAEAQLKKLPLRKLTVAASSPGAKVFVEGREAGTAPVTLQLPAGKYRISGRLGEIAVPRATVDLTRDDGQVLTLDFAVAEALRPSWGPGLALPEGDRQGSLVIAGAFLGLDKLLASSFSAHGDVTYLVGAYYDVRRGMLLREGSVRLTKGVAAPGSVSALASFLATGQTSELVAAGVPPATPGEASHAGVGALGAGSAGAASAGAPGAPSAGAAAGATSAGAAPDASVASAAPPPALTRPPAAKVPGSALPRASANAKPKAPAAPAKPPPPQPSKALGWAAVGASVIALGAGGFAVYEGVSANNDYSQAKGMLEPNSKTLQAAADPGRFKDYVSSGDSAKSKAYLATGVAAGAAVVAGILFLLAQ